jgi:hypothetical protein
LRDVTIDQGAFSIFSHDTKFTGCFRAYPDDDFEIYAFIGMRGNSRAEYVQAKLTPNDSPALWSGDFLQIPEEGRPSFAVSEVALRELRLPSTAPTRPYEFLRSDVRVHIDECPDFTYFQ